MTGPKRMEASSTLPASATSTGPSSSSSEQLRRLTKHILGPGVPPAIQVQCQWLSPIEEPLFRMPFDRMFQESRFRSALKVLSTAPAAAANIDDVKMDEFVIAEQIKKFLVNT